MHLGADHKAQQVGDLVQVVFNFAVNSTSSDVTSANNSYNLGLGQGTGLANVSLLRFGAGLQGGRQTQSSKTAGRPEHVRQHDGSAGHRRAAQRRAAHRRRPAARR